MFLRNSLNIFLLFVIIFKVSSSYAFEAVSIDDFFKKYKEKKAPKASNDKKAMQPISSKEAADNRINHIKKPKNLQLDKKDVSPNLSPVNIKKYNQHITALQYPIVQLLLLDRILGTSKVFDFEVGQTQLLANTLDVTIKNCIQRKTEFSNAVHSVGMHIMDTNNNDPLKHKKLLYDDVFYIEMPGFHGFDNISYDIKPVKCMGKPKEVSLKKANKNNASNTNANAKLKGSSNEKIETIISNAGVAADL